MHVNRIPAATPETPEATAELGGMDVDVVLPSPNCPAELSPQHFTSPYCVNAHVCEAPTDTDRTPVDTGVAGGDSDVRPPFPN